MQNAAHAQAQATRGVFQGRSLAKYEKHGALNRAPFYSDRQEDCTADDNDDSDKEVDPDDETSGEGSHEDNSGSSSSRSDSGDSSWSEEEDESDSSQANLKRISTARDRQGPIPVHGVSVPDGSSMICCMTQIPTGKNQCASFQLSRWKYNNVGWGKRIAKKEKKNKNQKQDPATSAQNSTPCGPVPPPASLQLPVSPSTPTWARDSTNARRAKDSYKVRKVCLTRAVFMALMKQCMTVEVSAPAQGSGTGILHVPESQPYEDGVVFHVLDFRRLCKVLCRAYMIMSTDAATIENDLNDIQCFLNRAIPALARHAGASVRMCGVGSRLCKPWLALKHSIKEANIQPLKLALRNSGRGGVDGGGTRTPPMKRVDWYMHREWFMTHSVVSDQPGEGAGSKASNGATYSVRRFDTWGVEDGPDQQSTDMGSSDASGDHSMRRKRRKGMENSCVDAKYRSSPPSSRNAKDDCAMLFLGDDEAFTTRTERMRSDEAMRECVKRSKIRSTPFDSHVVEAVRRAMDGV